MNHLKDLIKITDNITVDISGSSNGFFIDDPIVIHSAENNDFISLEWFLIKYFFRTQSVMWRKKGQQLIRVNDRVIDRIDLEVKENNEIKPFAMYFDITHVFGK